MIIQIKGARIVSSLENCKRLASLGGNELYNPDAKPTKDRAINDSFRYKCTQEKRVNKSGGVKSEIKMKNTLRHAFVIIKKILIKRSGG
jgi:hypothetical protein